MKKLLLFASLLFNGILFAQSNYQSGFVIQNNGDTLKGFINYREWVISPSYIDFKLNITDKTSTKYVPQNIKGFQIGFNEIYRSYLGAMSINRTDVSELKNVSDTSSQTIAIFMKQIANGDKMSLYIEKDDIKARFFVLENNEKPVELLIYIKMDENRYEVVTPIYKGQLLLYVNKYRPGNNKLITKVNNATYSENDLEKIINEINNNHNIVIKSKLGFRSYFGFGINNTKSTIMGFSNNGFTPKLNAGFDFYDNPIEQKFIFRADFSYFYQTPKFDNFQVNYVALPSINQTLYFNQYNFAFSPQVLYNFYNKQNFKAFIGAGFSLNYSTYSNNKLVYIDYFHQENIVNNIYNYLSFNSNYQFIAGVVFNKKIELNLMYSTNSIYTNYAYFIGQNQINGLSIKYLLGK